MIDSLAASHAKGKFATDRIFGASALANAAVAKYGLDNVVNTTVGVMLDENEQMVCLPTVEKIYRNLPINEIITYAPIAGMPDFLEASIDLAFGEHRPEAYATAVASAGGTGVIHHSIWNYTELGDTVLTSDWYWSPYQVMSEDALRKITTYKLLDEKNQFNTNSFSGKVNELLQKQNNLLIILNTPAHNPTGYSLSSKEWDDLLGVLKEAAKNPDKNLILLVDTAYLDFAGPRQEARFFMEKFSNLPKNILVILAFSMSKSYTMYGQRTGSMIGISSNKEIAQEFADVSQFTCRATWSNINRACMNLLSIIHKDPALLAQVDAERNGYYQIIKERANVFVEESKEVGLEIFPYSAGFFLSIPTNKSEEICEKLHDYNIYAVPLEAGVRLAPCATPVRKMKGIAAKIKQVMQELKNA
ncbi:aminotransferase class I/II-fold pyridoxal phosphate-dependent enzyme [Selenomonadales bacterium OttesenSCG-928-I06]|nr:aminotransferase class I/II-fold pyridoxal phosphate-dependent enzyme [Selenomonadales bacterium OttesenSCG-928-I06]